LSSIHSGKRMGLVALTRLTNDKLLALEVGFKERYLAPMKCDSMWRDTLAH
jgi:hypothetical protein